MPPSVAGVEFATRVRACLAAGGLFVVNVLDAPGLVGTRRQVATLRRAFNHVSVVATPTMLRGRRDGNVVVIASSRPVPSHEIQTAAGRHGAPARRLTGDALDSFVGGTAAITP